MTERLVIHVDEPIARHSSGGTTAPRRDDAYEVLEIDRTFVAPGPVEFITLTFTV
jgi:hypothetical protein